MADPQIVLKKGLGKDGDSNIPYIRDHPTNYEWVDRVHQRAYRLVNAEDFERQIWCNTYFRHPPGKPLDFWRWRDTTSFDVWGWGGRGDPIGLLRGNKVWHRLFHDERPPEIWWIIWQGSMWVRNLNNLGQGSFEDAPEGPAGSDWEHLMHIHVTYLDDEHQSLYNQIFRGA